MPVIAQTTGPGEYRCHLGMLTASAINMERGLVLQLAKKQTIWNYYCYKKGSIMGHHGFTVVSTQGSQRGLE